MRLKKIQISGFKSFVDPTAIKVPCDIIGIVGPNGCGKSNVIDAVRWVMGESSAKNLRGDSMADVIFNGSSVRKPVGKASVELIFDNADSSAPGPYAQFAEIAIKRTLARDGASDYFINNSSCRRRDITDIFLGTGLGPRSYSIIEQGMVSRIIEARPEELRILVEEAAGISKYKDRRRDTETRIRHTRENLLRVEDIRSELETQLRRLKRQSQAAQRYKELKQRERLLQAQLLSLRWQALSEQVREHDSAQARLQTEREREVAALRSVESDIERARGEHLASQEAVSQIQGELYRLGAEIAGVEQRIEHAHEIRGDREQETGKLVEALAAVDDQLAAERARLARTEADIAATEPRLRETAERAGTVDAALERAERAYTEWQALWERFGADAAAPAQQREIERSRIDQLERHLELTEERRRRIEQDAQQLDDELAGMKLSGLRAEVAEHDRVCIEREQLASSTDERIREHRRLVEQTGVELEARRLRQQELGTRLSSLREIQAAAMGEHDEQALAFLRERGLDGLPRLAAQVHVRDGWELAVDRILGGKLAALCVDDLDGVGERADALTDAELYVVQRGPRPADPIDGPVPRLIDYVDAGGVDMSPFLGGIFAVEDVAQALGLRSTLSTGECFVTRTGAIVGSNWLSFGRRPSAKAGLLSRAQEIERLDVEEAMLEQDIEALRARNATHRESLQALEEQRATTGRQLAGELQRRTELHNRLGHQEAHETQLLARRQQLSQDLDEIRAQIGNEQGAVDAARLRLSTAVEEMGSYEQQRDRLLEERDRLRREFEQSRSAAGAARDERHQTELEHQRLRSVLESAGEGVARLSAQLENMTARRAELETLLAAGSEPERQLQVQLDELLESRLEVEQRLSAARESLTGLTARLRELDELRLQREQHVERARAAVEEMRVERQALSVRLETLNGQVQELGCETSALLEQMPEDASVDTWAEQVEKLAQRIERIGPVNLVAIEEFEEQTERKEYLDKQHLDLTDALSTLEDVIRKIDRETRSRFKTTFDALNQGFQSYFPKLFGGGSAYLELSEEDLLTAGVSVMARPPGKRNSTIHLLSGGEKALTAVSLLFAFFELNPAPFCLLDEVDAPLDDANVERYCQTLRSLAGRTQLIFVTHNKITMEAADILLGVTMAEPGVSRLVSVDVEQAVEMAAP